MKTCKLYQLLLILMAISLASCEKKVSSIITYTAVEKLKQTDSEYFYGLHTNAFNVPISSHKFSNGTGTITFSEKLTTIGDYAFYGCLDMTSVTIPNSVTTIGENAFYLCESLKSFTIPDSVTSIGTFAFSDCSSLTSITIPNSVTDLSWRVFEGCTNLANVSIGNSVTSIEYGTFCLCKSLTSVTIPNSVTWIGNNAFASTNLTFLTIGSSVTEIGKKAFSSTNLKSITCRAIIPPTCGDDCFEYVPNTVIVHVPAQSIKAYKKANGWKNFNIVAY